MDCPAGWSLTTTEDLRTYSSLLDVVPSALESRGSANAAMYTNHDLYGMYKAMSAHKSQSRWCVLLCSAYAPNYLCLLCKNQFSAKFP